MPSWSIAPRSTKREKLENNSKVEKELNSNSTELLLSTLNNTNNKPISSQRLKKQSTAQPPMPNTMLPATVMAPNSSLVKPAASKMDPNTVMQSTAPKKSKRQKLMRKASTPTTGGQTSTTIPPATPMSTHAGTPTKTTLVNQSQPTRRSTRLRSMQHTSNTTPTTHKVTSKRPKTAPKPNSSTAKAQQATCSKATSSTWTNPFETINNTKPLVPPTKHESPQPQQSPTKPNMAPTQLDNTTKGKSNEIALMHIKNSAHHHPATTMLQEFEDPGCPVDCGVPWDRNHIVAAVKRGPHISAKQKEARIQLHQEISEKIREGFAKTVKWKDIKHDIPKNLKISPIAAIPHKSRGFRFILDLSFGLRLDGIEMPSVNLTTAEKAPHKAMEQLGRVLPRIIQTLAKADDQSTPFLFSKLDIKDGFWRMIVNEMDAWNFCYILPPIHDEHQDLDEVEIVVPTCLQMGWTQSPPFFCAATETARDLAQEKAETPIGSLPQHPLEDFMLPPNMWKDYNATEHIAKFITALLKFEVYVDDFIALAQSTDPTQLQHASRALLHAVHELFPPPSETGHVGGDPISEKKLRNNDGLWAHRKEILGWIFDGITKCLELPPDKFEKISTILKTTIKQHSVPTKEFQNLVGKLRHASLALPSAKGLFTPINHALQNDPQYINIKSNKDLKLNLQDWKYLLNEVKKRPTSVHEVVHKEPHYIGYCDASGHGAGGVWLSGSETIQPTVWQIEFPPEIRKRLVSESNPKGDITNSDLEMAGVVLHFLVLENLVDLTHKTVGIYCDNTPTVYWTQKMSSKRSNTAGRLLRALAIRQKAQQSAPVIILPIAGKQNVMADTASRALNPKEFTTGQGSRQVSHKTFLQVFQSQFPLPQEQKWRQFHLSKKLTTRVTSELVGKRLAMESWQNLPHKGGSIGNTGKNMQQAPTLTPTSNTNLCKTNISTLSPVFLLGSGQETTATKLKSEFNLFRKQCEVLPRPSNWLDIQAHSTETQNITS